MKILVVVDMQNDFIDGALGTPEAQAIVPNVKKKIESYRDAGMTGAVIYTMDTHQDNYLETMEGKKLPVPHCIYRTPGWEIPSVLKPNGQLDRVLYKETFGSTSLSDLIGSNFGGRIDSIEVVGLCTDICVISNVMLLKAHFPDTPIYVDSSCCAGVTPESHENALKAMAMCHIEII